MQDEKFGTDYSEPAHGFGCQLVGVEVLVVRTCCKDETHTQVQDNGAVHSETDAVGCGSRKYFTSPIDRATM